MRRDVAGCSHFGGRLQIQGQSVDAGLYLFIQELVNNSMTLDSVLALKGFRHNFQPKVRFCATLVDTRMPSVFV